VRGALRRLRAAPLLFGGRGRPAVDVDAVALTAQRLGELLLERELEAIECNPVVALTDGAGVIALDALVGGAGPLGASLRGGAVDA
jgi:acetyl-CoA synthetase (ADP-forming)